MSKNADAARRWRERNPEKVKALSASRVRPKGDELRDLNLRRYYGIGIDEVRALHAAQEGCCKLCGRSVTLFTGVRRDSGVVDHCHTTGAVRGILCAQCNVGLGSFGEAPELLEAAAQYIRAHRRG